MKSMQIWLNETLNSSFSYQTVKTNFAENQELANVTPIYKTGDWAASRNYRSIPTIQCFLKTLERIMYIEVSPKPCQTSKMRCFVNIAPEYVSEHSFLVHKFLDNKQFRYQKM